MRRGADGKVELVEGRWGLVPSYHFKPIEEFKLSTWNARWEDKVRRSPTYAPSWRAGHRCVIPVEWFVEPNWESGKHVPWKFAAADGRAIGLAGLWNRWRGPDGVWVETYTMITINADSHELMKRMHRPTLGPDRKPLPAEEQDKRMVVVLDDEAQQVWLHGTPAEAETVVKQWPAENFSSGPLIEGPTAMDPATGELF